jgi:hypothetical protein
MAKPILWRLYASLFFSVLTFAVGIYFLLQMGYKLVVTSYGQPIKVAITHIPVPCRCDGETNFEFMYAQQVHQKLIPDALFCKKYKVGDYLTLRYAKKYPKKFLWEETTLAWVDFLPILIILGLSLLLAMRLQTMPNKPRAKRKAKR